MKNSGSKAFYEDLLQKAVADIDDKLNGRALMVSAQMRVDGDSTILTQNLDTLRQIITVLREAGDTVFDQIPWLDINIPGAPQDYAVKFEIFWKGLISSGRIYQLLVPQESRGTRGVESEIDYALEAGVVVRVDRLEALLTRGAR